MDLISTQERESYEAAINDLHDSFARPITVITQTKTPQSGLSDSDDDYDFTQGENTGSEEFVYAQTETTIRARIKYIDKQDKEFALVNTLGGEQINLAIEFGIIRIKVLIADTQLVQEAASIIVDGNNCNILFRDRPHGLFAPKYHTFYLQRTP